MAYYLLKIIHIISASLFLGSIIGMPLYTLIHKKICYQQPVTQTTPAITQLLMRISLLALIIQPITGFTIIAIQHYNPMSHWVIASLIGFALIGCLWLVNLYLQQCANAHKHLKHHQRWQHSVLCVTLLVLLTLYYLMITKPE